MSDKPNYSHSNGNINMSFLLYHSLIINNTPGYTDIQRESLFINGVKYLSMTDTNGNSYSNNWSFLNIKVETSQTEHPTMLTTKLYALPSRTQPPVISQLN